MVSNTTYATTAPYLGLKHDGVASEESRAAFPCSDTQYVLPKFIQLFPRASHPQTVQIEARSDAWAKRRLGPCCKDAAALTDWLSMRISLYGPMGWPHGATERVYTMSNWWNLTTFIDDLAVLSGDWRTSNGQLARLTETLMTVLEGGEPPEEPHDVDVLAAALKEIWDNITSTSTRALQRRIIDSIGILLDGYQGEVRWREKRRVPDLETYLEVRDKSFNSAMIAAMTEFVLGIDLTDVMRTEPEIFRRLHKNFSYQLIFTNDVFSFRKEWIDGDLFNAIGVFCATEGMPLQRAVDHARDLAVQHGREFIATRNDLLGSGLGQRSDVQQYVRELGYNMAGSEEYQLLNPRYYGVGYRWDGTRTGLLDLTTLDAQFLPIPSQRSALTTASSQSGPPHET